MTSVSTAAGMTSRSLAALLERLGNVERRLRAAIAERRQTDPNPDDAFRGLYLSDDMVDALLAQPRMAFGEPDTPASTVDGRLGRLAGAARLTELDVELLLVALAPDVDSRFEQFYGYLNDDVTRRRATIGLALRLCGVPEGSAAGRARLDAGAPLAAAALLTIEDADRPLLGRTLRVPDRVVGHLLGDDRPDSALADVLHVDPVDPDGLELPGIKPLSGALRAAVRLMYLREWPGGGAAALATAALSRAGFAAGCAWSGSSARTCRCWRSCRTGLLG